jgi:hypothetical protein
MGPSPRGTDYKWRGKRNTADVQYWNRTLFTMTTNTNSINLNETSAYQAMHAFLEEYWKRGKSDEIAILLGSMQLMKDGKPADPALWSDWLKVAQRFGK